VEHARFAKSFDEVAQEYERGRPSYPPAAVDHIAEALCLGPDATVVDLAAGTGKLTRELPHRFRRVIAVEPLGEMLAQLELALPEVEAMTGRAEEIPVDDQVVDGVFCAQAFHWFANAEALDEIARVLRPGGGLGLIWNISPWETHEGPWFSALDELLSESPADMSVTRRHAQGGWRGPIDADQRFTELTHASFSHEQRLSREDFIASLRSRSYMAMLEPAQREEIISTVEGMFDRPDAPLDGDELVIPQNAHVFTTRLRTGS
jgi:ubiquinone/menaquinone biosynthesis C-methylase UbiE